MAQRKKRPVHARPAPKERTAVDPAMAARERYMRKLQEQGILPPTGGKEKKKKKKGKGSQK